LLLAVTPLRDNKSCASCRWHNAARPRLPVFRNRDVEGATDALAARGSPVAREQFLHKLPLAQRRAAPTAGVSQPDCRCFAACSIFAPAEFISALWDFETKSLPNVKIHTSDVASGVLFDIGDVFCGIRAPERCCR
jgi:hypothetical protein